MANVILPSVASPSPLPVTHWQLSNSEKNELLSRKIEKRMRQLELTKLEFARLIGVQPSSITKWLSGKHNFTLETLYEIERKLSFPLIDLSTAQKANSVVFRMHITSSDTPTNNAKRLLSSLGSMEESQEKITTHRKVILNVGVSISHHDIRPEEYMPSVEFWGLVKHGKNNKD